MKALKLKMLFVDNIKKCNGTSMVFNLSLSLCVRVCVWCVCVCACVCVRVCVWNFTWLLDQFSTEALLKYSTQIFR